MPPSMQQRKRIREKQKDSRGRIKTKQEEEKRQRGLQSGNLIESGMDDPFIQDQLAREAKAERNKPGVPDKIKQGVTYAAGVPLGAAAGLTAETGSALLDALGSGKDAVVDKFRDITKDKVKSEDLPQFDAPALEPSSNNTADIKEAVSKLSKPQQNIVSRTMQGSSPFRSSAGFPGTDSYKTPNTNDYGALFEALAPEKSSETIQPTKAVSNVSKPAIKSEAPIEDVDSGASDGSKDYWNEQFDRLAAMEPEDIEAVEAVEEIMEDDAPELMAQDMNRPVDEEEFAEFMANPPEFMRPASNLLADLDVYVDDEGKTRVRESIDKIASEQSTPQMAEGPATLSSLFANLFDPVSKAIEDLYTKSRLSNSSAEKYEIMDEIEDLQKLQGPERTERYSGPGATRSMGERRDKTSDRNVPQRILNQMRAAQMRR
jgi:hypothetical protein